MFLNSNSGRRGDAFYVCGLFGIYWKWRLMMSFRDNILYICVCDTKELKAWESILMNHFLCTRRFFSGQSSKTLAVCSSILHNKSTQQINILVVRSIICVLISHLRCNPIMLEHKFLTLVQTNCLTSKLSFTGFICRQPWKTAGYNEPFRCAKHWVKKS